MRTWLLVSSLSCVVACQGATQGSVTPSPSGSDAATSSAANGEVATSSEVAAATDAASADPGPPQPPGPPSYTRNVKPILESTCTRCHTPGGIKGDLPLQTYAQVAPLKDLIKLETHAKRMPPWLAGPSCADYAYEETLTADQIVTLAAWADAGAPEGGVNDPPDVLPKVKVPGLSRVDATLEMPVDYAPLKSPDDYRCFLVEWPQAVHQSKTRYITGFGVKPGNGTIVHHVIAFLVPPNLVKSFEAMDANEAGPGYTCFGGAVADGGAVSGIDQAQVAWIGAWAPGSAGSDLPAGTGVRIEPGSKVVIQVHYNTLAASGVAQTDRSSISLKVDDAVDREGFTLPFANPDWLSGNGMDIPAGEKAVMHSFTSDVTQWLPYLYGGDWAQFELHTASLHMHVHGVKARAFIKRKDGTEECLLDIPRWDFGWQRSYPFKVPRPFATGDRLGIECVWDNSAEAQPWVDGKPTTPKLIQWGEGTGDEMCLGVFYITAAKKTK